MSVQKPRIAFGLASVVQLFAVLILIVVCIVTVRYSHPGPSGPKVAAIRVTNMREGETLSYPVAMLTGRIDLAPTTPTDPQDDGSARRPLVIEILNRDHLLP